MFTIEESQSLTDLRRMFGETLDRVNRTGEAEMIIDRGQPRGVLLSPAAYDAMRDAAAIQSSRRDISQGKVFDLETVSAEIRSELLAKKSARDQTT